MTCGIAIPVEGHVVLASGSRILAGTHRMPDLEKILPLCGFQTLCSGTLYAERRCRKLLVEQRASIQGKADVNLEQWADAIANLEIPSELGAEFILAKGRELYRIDTDGAFYPNLKTYQTIGSGGDIALGYLGASRAPKTVEQAKKLALNCLKFVSEHMVCEGPPFTVEVT